MRKSRKSELNTDRASITAVLQDTERRANRLAVYVFAVCFIVLLLTTVLTKLGIYRLQTGRSLMWKFIFLTVICVIPIAAHIIKKVPQHVLRWINISCIILFSSMAYLAFSYNAALAMLAPLIFAVAYFSEKTTLITYLSTIVVFGCAEYFGSFGYSMPDSNHVAVPRGTVLTVETTLKQALIDSGFLNSQYVRNMMVLDFLPKLVMSLLFLVFAVAITHFGYNMLIKQAKDTAESTRVGAELKFAGDLQLNALPSVSAINGKYNFEIAASMTPAREAGGDFYDFMMIDDTHLALVIADVCGKGVPAAMFMMSAKEKLRSALASGRSPGDVLYLVNNDLCENNRQRMFVTVWLGIVDITTGIIVSANSGHEDPIVQKASSTFVTAVEKHGMGAGVRRDRTYPEQEYRFMPGDILVQYTDGVTEAKNENDEMFGEARLLEGLNSRFKGKNPSAEEINFAVREQVKDFVGTAKQSDDLTTLIFRFM